MALKIFKMTQRVECERYVTEMVQKGHEVEMVKDWDKVLVLVTK